MKANLVGLHRWMWRVLVVTLGATGGGLAAAPALPRLVGDWWQIAGDPPLGELTAAKQQPVDFGLWQAADGTWQLWSCIRATKEVGKTRLFHRWEGKALTASHWRPMGVAMRADPKFGESPGGLQAPFVFRADDRFVMFYGSWTHICAQDSRDGKAFTRRLDAAATTGLFGGPFEQNTRDPMVLRHGALWICYYTAHPNKTGAVYARTSSDLRQWGPEQVVAPGGVNSSDPRFSAECPFVVEPRPGEFYLFATQRYGRNAQTTVRVSRDPLNFRGNEGGKGEVLGTLPIAAPEILQHEGAWYLAALRPDLKGIQVSRLEWP